MAEWTPEKITEVGLNPTYNAANAGGDTVVNPSNATVYLHAKNGDASQHTVTVTAERTNFDNANAGRLRKANISVDIPAGEERLIGPLPNAAFGERPALSYDDVTSVTVGVFRL